MGWVEGKCIQNSWGRDLKEEDHLESLSVGGRIILKWISKK